MSSSSSSSRPWPIIVAHRGLHHGHPENALAAFRAAWNAGFAWCECDVQAARGGELVVIHDDTLDRTTAGAGAVADHPLVSLRELGLRLADGSITTERLASLDELLTIMRPDDALLVEIKPRLTADALRAAMRRLEGHETVVQSFHAEVVRVAADLGCRTAWLTDDAQWLRSIEASPGDAIHVRHDLLDRDAVERCRAAGKRVGAWTVNRPADVDRVLALGVDVIISDEPHRVRAATGAIRSRTR